MAGALPDVIVLGDELFPGTELPVFVPLVVPASVPPEGAPLPEGRCPEVTPPVVPPLPAPLPPAPWAEAKLSGVIARSPAVSHDCHEKLSERIILSFRSCRAIRGLSSVRVID